MERAVPPLVVFTDYKSIVDGLRRGKGWCTAGDKMQADRWSRIWEGIERWPKGSLVAKHVNSHQQVKDIGTAEGRVIWLGNWVADGIAKAGAKRWRVDVATREEHVADWKQYRRLARLGGRVMVRAAEERPWKKEGKRWMGFQEERGLRERGPRHWLFKIGGRTRCAFCPQYADTAATLRRLRCTPCRGSVEDRVTGLGHTLARSCDIVGGRAGVLWCVRCGAYAETSARGLAKVCTGVPTRAGDRNIRLLRAGWHPRQMRRLHAPSKVEEEPLGWQEGPSEAQGEGAEDVAGEGGSGGGVVGQEVGIEEEREGVGQEAAFLEPPSEDYVQGLIMAGAEQERGGSAGAGEEAEWLGAGGGGQEEMPRAGAPGAGAGGTGRGWSASSGTGVGRGRAVGGSSSSSQQEAGRKRDVYSMRGVIYGDTAPVEWHRASATKRSRFRF